MSKDLNITRLCDAYGALLTAHRLEIIRNYYDDDLSLAEIAENLGITRQAALCSIKQAEKQLLEYESKLKIVETSDKLQLQIDSALSVIDTDVDRAKQELRQIVTEILR
ncbi:MAG: DNA-binding protein [Clostridiales bacterium]|nr:DNA-binding protein [Clostridiales bacterium]